MLIAVFLCALIKRIIDFFCNGLLHFVDFFRNNSFIV